jgi:hypothetical protein
MGFQQSPNDPTWPYFSDKQLSQAPRRMKAQALPSHSTHASAPLSRGVFRFSHPLPLKPTLHFCGKVCFLGPLLGNLNRAVVLSFSNQPGVQWDR